MYDLKLLIRLDLPNIKGRIYQITVILDDLFDRRSLSPLLESGMRGVKGIDIPNSKIEVDSNLHPPTHRRNQHLRGQTLKPDHLRLLIR
jgi:hypothetical protein